MAFKYDYIKEGQSVEWQRKSHQIQIRDNYTCRVCRATNKQVQVHHTWYNQDLHYWDYPNHQLITLCKECHEKETKLSRLFRGLRKKMDEDVVMALESCMKAGVPLVKLENAFTYMGLSDNSLSLKNTNIEQVKNIQNVDNHGTIVESRINPLSIDKREKPEKESNSKKSLSIGRRKRAFLNDVKKFKNDYSSDYLETFTTYWTTLKAGKMRFEEEPNAMDIRLEEWKKIIMAH